MGYFIGILIITLFLLDVRQGVRIWHEEKKIIITFLKGVWNYVKDWRTFVSFLLAWSITNGWCYIFIILGTWLKIKWMRITGWTYLAFLWLPTTPEKLITVPLSVAIKKILFKKSKKNVDKK